MKKIRRDSDITEIAALVSEALERAGITAVLSGGAAVSIYTENAYMSRDLDFVSSESLERIEEVLSELDFERVSIRYFTHKDTDFFVEFPSGPLSFGDDIVRDWGRLETASGVIQMVIGPAIEPTGKSVTEITAEVEEWIETTVNKLPKP